MASLELPAHLKLKGATNYVQWEEAIKNLALYHGLDGYFDSHFSQRLESDGDSGGKQILDHPEEEFIESQDRLMRRLIQFNIYTGPAQILAGMKTSKEMWNALRTQYMRSKIVQKYNAITSYLEIKYEDYSNLEAFIVAFRENVNVLSNLELAPPRDWHRIMFIMLLKDAWPIWSDRQRSNYRNGTVLSLEDLIRDITDEAAMSGREHL